MRRRYAIDQDDDSIDMTPMLDIIFIILIFFIVTTSFIKESGVEVQKPVAQSTKQKSGDVVLIALEADNDIWINKRRVDVRSIRANMERFKMEMPNVSVVIVSDKNSKTGYLVRIMDQVKLAGIKDISIAANNE